MVSGKGVTVKPGVSRSTRMLLMPSAPFEGSVLAMTMKCVAISEFVISHLRPLIT
jgi:hypothetical protein